MEQFRDNLYILGSHTFPSFLIVGTEKIALIDTGIACMGPRYVEDIEGLLGKERGPDFLFFTHSHFDHVGGAPHLIGRYENSAPAGSSYLFRVMEREGARKTIEALNRKMSRRFSPETKLTESDFDYRVIKPGVVIRDGDRIDLGGGIVIEVIATPGHTKDSTSYFIPHIGVVITGEALGIIPGDEFYVAPEFLTGYEDYVDSIEKVRAKDPAVILTGHHTIILKEDIDRFFDQALSDTKAFKEKIAAYLDEESMDEEKVVERIAREEYIPLRKQKQPEEAYRLNLTAQVRLIARDLRKNT
jgi:glyoxylase-like metal-dependent hydrolase (beta-lactamase superfamily II)